jgi:hypothetical protein
MKHEYNVNVAKFDEIFSLPGAWLEKDLRALLKK